MHNFKVRFIKVHLCMIAVHDLVQPSGPNAIGLFWQTIHYHYLLKYVLPMLQ